MKVRGRGSTLLIPHLAAFCAWEAFSFIVSGLDCFYSLRFTSMSQGLQIFISFSNDVEEQHVLRCTICQDVLALMSLSVRFVLHLRDILPAGYLTSCFDPLSLMVPVSRYIIFYVPIALRSAHFLPYCFVTARMACKLSDRTLPFENIRSFIARCGLDPGPCCRTTVTTAQLFA